MSDEHTEVPTTEEPETQEPHNEEPETQEPDETQEPTEEEPQEPTTEEPETQEPTTEEPQEPAAPFSWEYDLLQAARVHKHETQSKPDDPQWREKILAKIRDSIAGGGNEIYVRLTYNQAKELRDVGYVVVYNGRLWDGNPGGEWRIVMELE